MTTTVAPPGTSAEQLRMMSLAARLYHVQGIRQRDIAERLGVSQARVSRLLRLAEERGIVRRVLMVPEGLHPELEERVEEAYGLSEVHVVEVQGGDAAVAHTLGWAAAHFFPASTLTGKVTGFTSWSTTLQQMALALDQPLHRSSPQYVVEMLGDLGSPVLQHSAARATSRLAAAVGAEAVFLRTPGVFRTAQLRDAALADAHVQRALRLLDRLDVAFVGVGPLGLDRSLTAGPSFFSAEELGTLQGLGAVAQLNQRFIDAEGQPVDTPLDDRVIGVSLEQLRAARRRVVVAGGSTKQAAIAAVLRGGWIDSLMTDVATARYLTRHCDQPLVTAARRTLG
jgi:DNA-binding transcriptional regulator LsrR (DeoR family)